MGCITEAGVTVANKAVSDDSGSQSRVYYSEGEKRFLKILTPPKSAGGTPFLSLSLVLSPFLSHRAFLVPRNKLFLQPRYHLSG